MTQALHDAGNDVYFMDADYVRPGLAAIHIMRSGDELAIIDTGTAHAARALRTAIDGLNLGPDAVRLIIVTHVHLDHAGGAGTLMQYYPHASLIAHPRAVRHLVDPSRLIAGTMEVYGAERMRELYGNVIPIEPDRIIVADDGYTAELNGRKLLFLDTPGHARHHFCVIDVDHAGIFSGDTLGVSYREFDTERGPFLFPTTTPVQFEPEALHRSIDRLMEYQPKTVYLTHFGPIAITPELVENLHGHIDQYVELTLAVEGLEETKQTQALTAALHKQMVEALHEHGCRLPDKQLDELLGPDVYLNTQGLLVWLARKNRPAKPKT